MKKSILALLLFIPAFGAFADNSPKDVQALINRGDYAGAETMLRQAVTEHPQSAKAHYVLAEVLAHEGNIGDAKAEASKAAQLDPQTKFTDPAKFQRFQQELNSALGNAPRARTNSAAATYAAPAPQPAEKTGGGLSSTLVGLLVFGGVIALIAFMWSRRRAANNNYVANQSPFGGSAPYNNYQGGVPPYAPPPSSGAGAAVAAGLGGLAAGALLDEAFRSHNGNEGSSNGTAGAAPVADTPDPRGQAYDDLRSDPIDMGNDNSWDDSSSSDTGSDDDQW